MGKKSKITEYLKKNLSPKRFEHSLGVAKLAKKLAKKNNLPSKKAYLAGLLHDAAKELSDSKLLELAERDGFEIQAFEKERPSLLHGRAAAVLAKEMWGIKNKNVLQGIRDHIMGRPGMSQFSMIIYCADLLEPNRGFFDEALRKEVLSYDIEKMTLWTFDFVLKDLKKRKRRIVQSSIKLYKELEERIKKRG